jgi:hypothetical protein
MSERARYASEQELRTLVREAFCGVDTCSLVALYEKDIEQSEGRQKYFLSTLERICREERQRIFTSVSVYEELHSLTKRGNPTLARFAERAIAWVERLNADGLLLISERRATEWMHADQELFLICCDEYVRNKVVIITQDNDLAAALHKQNSNKMTRHYPMLVRRINMKGHLTEFDFEGRSPVHDVERPRENSRGRESERLHVDNRGRENERPRVNHRGHEERRFNHVPQTPPLRLSTLGGFLGEKLRGLCDRIFFNN